MSTPPTARRDFLRAGAATGFALAVLPVGAETLHTPADGLLAGPVDIPAPDRSLPAYRAQPLGKGPFPVVLVVQEIFGVHEHIRDVCRRFAQLGYLAIAPELYVRQGDVSQLTSIDEIIRAVVAKVPDAQVMADLDATASWAQQHGGSAALAVTGFCWGGRITWLYAEHNPALKAAAAWYGRLRGSTSAVTPQHPIDGIATLHAPVLGLYGGRDQGIPQADIDAMRLALQQAGKEADIMVFADAEHGFHADYRPSYDPDAARLGWARMLAWFRAHGAG